MKKLFFYLAFASLSACTNFHSSQAVTSSTSQEQSTSSSSSKLVSGSTVDINTYTLTKTEDGNTYKLTAKSSTSMAPNPKINLNLSFEKSWKKVSDSLTTQDFLKFFDLKDAKKIEVDSLKYLVENENIDLRFMILLTKEDQDKSKKIDKYSFKYLSNFENSKPTLSLLKSEK